MNETSEIQPGAWVRVRDAYGTWHEAQATSAVELTHRDGRRIHDFPVVWVKFTPTGEDVPWPIEDVVG